MNYLNKSDFNIWQHNWSFYPLVQHILTLLNPHEFWISLNEAMRKLVCWAPTNYILWLRIRHSTHRAVFLRASFINLRWFSSSFQCVYSSGALLCDQKSMTPLISRYAFRYWIIPFKPSSNHCGLGKGYLMSDYILLYIDNIWCTLPLLMLCFYDLASLFVCTGAKMFFVDRWFYAT